MRSCSCSEKHVHEKIPCAAFAGYILSRFSTTVMFLFLRVGFLQTVRKFSRHAAVTEGLCANYLKEHVLGRVFILMWSMLVIHAGASSP